jgi:hypothetical protein
MALVPAPWRQVHAQGSATLGRALTTTTSRGLRHAARCARSGWPLKLPFFVESFHTHENIPGSRLAIVLASLFFAPLNEFLDINQNLLDGKSLPGKLIERPQSYEVPVVEGVVKLVTIIGNFKQTLILSMVIP